MSKNQKANSIHPHLCVAIYTFRGIGQYTRSIGEVFLPYTSEYTAVNSEVYSRILGVYGDFLPPTHATILINYPPPLHLLMTLQPPNTLYTQKSTI